MKVKTYLGHDVPSGATYYNAANMLWPEAFYNHDATARNKVDSANGWMPHSGGLPTTAIELPEEETKPDWDNAPTDTAVWIEDNKANSGNDFSGWHYDIDSDGRYYECGSRDYVSDRNSNMFTVHHRPEIKPEESWIDNPCWVETIKEASESIAAIVSKIKPEVWDGKGSKVGKRVRASVVGNDKWEECLVKFCDKDSDIVVVRFDSHGDDTPIRLPWRFLPIKTQDEKDREAFILSFQNAVCDAVGTHTGESWASIEDIATELMASFDIKPKADSGR